MNPLRLVVVTTRYWPLVGPTEYALSELISAWRELGARPRVVTARWSNAWSEQVWHRLVPVTRLPSVPRGSWTTMRYLRELAQHLRAASETSDLLLVHGLRDEAATAISSADERCPVALLPGPSGVTEDCRWFHTSRATRRAGKLCQQAAACIAHTESEARELRLAGFPAARVVELPYGVPVYPERHPDTRRAARQALGEVNPDLAAPETRPVAVCVERLEACRGLLHWIDIWSRIADRWPEAQLWIIGDGPQRRELYEALVERDLHRHILLPGSFDDLEGVFAAADIYVGSPQHESIRFPTLAAMAAGLPVVAVNTPDHHAMIESSREGLLVNASNFSEFADAIGQLFEKPALAVEFGAAARRRVTRECALQDVAARYLTLFEKIAAGEREFG